MDNKVQLSDAVDEFGLAMKIRLFQKADEGYTGWDGEYQYPSLKLAEEITADAKTLEHAQGADLIKKLCVDIANRAMMLHYRTQATGKDNNV